MKLWLYSLRATLLRPHGYDGIGAKDRIDSVDNFFKKILKLLSQISTLESNDRHWNLRP
jgi:hypothetical protein